MPRTYILLACDGPEAATEAEAVGHITGVLAQHGALGVHHTVRGEVTVSLLAGSTAPDVDTPEATALHLMQALRGLAFDVNLTARPFGIELGVDHDEAKC
jgi:hypothetical protein